MKKTYLRPETESSWLQSDKDWMDGTPGGATITASALDGDGQTFAPSRRLYV